MQPRLPDELLRSHEHLSGLEQELGKQRDALIREYQRGGATSTQQIFGSYYPMLERFTALEDQYVAELSKFKNGLKHTVDQNQRSQQVTAGINTTQQPQTVPVVNMNVNQPQPVINNNVNNVNNVATNNNAQSRKIANNGYGVNNGMNNGINNDDAKQPDMNVNVSTQQTSAQQASTETEMKVSSLYNDPNGVNAQQQQAGPLRRTKPPVRQSQNNNTASLSIPVQNQQPQQPQAPRNAAQMVQSPPSGRQSSQIVQRSSAQSQDAPPQRLVQQRKPKKIVVNRHKYKYEGRGFDIWTRNLKRPIYTSTTIKINKTFGKNEKAIKTFLSQKGGLRENLIEQVTFIDPKKSMNNQRGRNNRGRGGRNDDQRSMKPFTIVRVRTSLTNIKNVIDRIQKHPDLTKENEQDDFIRKQNNRTRVENRHGTSNKLYVNNFDILDKNTHWALTKIFLKFGELEQDIFIGRDKRQNPYAFVVFRSREAAKRCIQQHQRRETAIYYPPKQQDKDNDYQSGSPTNKVYLNRKLHIEYNISKDDGNNSYNNRGSNRGRRGGRGGRGNRGGRGRR